MTDKGLSQSQAAERLSRDGLNTLEVVQSHSFLKLFIKQFDNPIVYFLFIAAFVTIFVGRSTDWMVIIAAALVNSLMGAIQEGRAEKSLRSLKELINPMATVIRDGIEQTIPSKNLVKEDLVILITGDIVPADIQIIQEQRCSVNEAIMTGESHVVAKTVGEVLLSGTHLTSGKARGTIVATGWDTELGKIAKLAVSSKPPKTPVEKRIQTLCNQLGIASVAMFLLLFTLGLIQGLPWNEMLMAGISVVVSMIPEGLPIAVTIALAVGIHKMAQEKAIVRRLIAVETLGSTTVICSDKTGTLTKNALTVVKVYLPKGKSADLPFVSIQQDPDFKKLVRASILCNDAFWEEEEITKRKLRGDPTEIALIHLGHEAQIDELELRRQYPRIEEIPFDFKDKAMATAHRSEHESVIALKGAIEVILSLCIDVNEEAKKTIISNAEEQAKNGLRVLALAEIVDGTFDPSHGISQFAGKAHFLGFVSMQDLPREEAFAAVKACREAGIRPVMITGDHMLTAKSIGSQLGIYQVGDAIMDGATFDALSHEELLKQIGKVSVFARMHPVQKVKIVEVLQEMGEVVAMTGDGVNDSPALSKADVGVAMGSGTEIAKDMAKITILDDNFATIVKAVERGRIVYKNIKLVVYYLLSTSIAGVLLMVVAVALGYPLPLTAVQILWINIITEGTVTINLIMEEGEGDEMHQPPPSVQDAILSSSILKKMAVVTPALAAILLGYFLLRYYQQIPLPLVQTEVFTLFAFCAWFKVLSCRSETKSAFKKSLLSNKYLIWGLISGVILQLLVLYLPIFNELFHTVPLSGQTMLKLFVIASAILWIDELLKMAVSKTGPALKP